LSTQFRRWLQSEDAFAGVDSLRELLRLEEFQSKLSAELRVWLVDQNPQTLSEAARLADQYAAVRKADHSEKVLYLTRNTNRSTGRRNSRQRPPLKPVKRMGPR